MKNFGRIMLIVGMVIGSGFASGKEIAVFFSRFGYFSYIFIPFAFLLFFGVFYWILSHGKNGIEKISSSKFYSSLYILISLVFTSSMFAGTKTTISTNVIPFDVVIVFFLLIFCIYVAKNGLLVLTKINSYLIPFTIFILMLCLIKNRGAIVTFENGSFFSGILFSILYVVMNISTSSFVIGQLGQSMSKRSMIIVSFFASFILSILLLFINLTLLKHPESLSYSMPLLQISGGYVYVLMRIVIFVGCLTTLLSLVYTTSQNLQKLEICGVFNILISIILPFLASFLGFGKIVSILYPIVSVLGILLVIPFLEIFNKTKNRG